ncbi:hypothetical protein BKA67DRAFT_406145 [Truncatella angustata]|uniref:Uncharacterized protein n=1 Tax=Truncatella angustata TaxID=152316 RepID=A0A9P8UDU6_9PEZI|nr:uncharacterized protein BKA67DRAFT_406145 [Truncatella angustata]KAH6648100.1 hypothetical protein BKA67DRAFT_406145 [Truncatella angustata]
MPFYGRPASIHECKLKNELISRLLESRCYQVLQATEFLANKGLYHSTMMDANVLIKFQDISCLTKMFLYTLEHQDGQSLLTHQYNGVETVVSKVEFLLGPIPPFYRERSRRFLSLRHHKRGYAESAQEISQTLFDIGKEMDPVLAEDLGSPTGGIKRSIEPDERRVPTSHRQDVTHVCQNS